MRKLWFAVALAAVLSTTSCKFYKDIEASGIEEVQMGEINTDGVEATLFFTIENPNWYNIVMKETKIDVYVEDKYFGQIDQYEKIVVPKKSKQTYQLRMTAKQDALDNLLGSALKLFFQNDLKLEAKGYAKGRALFVGKKIDIQVTDKITKEQLGF
ncbi:MAG: LEA type 2 family protein [Flavobacteriales bacterium]